jgi:hypothetical protein
MNTKTQKFEYRGVPMTTYEGFGPKANFDTFTVNGPYFAVTSECGMSFANTPEVALQGAQNLIDRHLNNK